MSSPFDDQPADAPRPAKRKRRPWWRWNLVTLMVALFLLVWVRELSRLEYGVTWLLAFSVIGLWGLVPFALVATPLTTMPLTPDSEEPESLRARRFSDMLLRVFRVVAVTLLTLSGLHFCYAFWMILDSFGFWGRRSFFRPEVIFTLLAPVFEFVAAATLYTLTEIALRLDPWSRR